MKKEKYIKDKLSNYQSPLDLDSMWANLEQDLDNDKEDRGILFYLKGILGIVTSILFIGLIIFSFYQLNNSTSQSTISENSTIESSTSKNNPALSAPTKNEIINDSDVNNSISNSTNSKVLIKLIQKLKLQNTTKRKAATIFLKLKTLNLFNY